MIKNNLMEWIKQQDGQYFDQDCKNRKSTKKFDQSSNDIMSLTELEARLLAGHYQAATEIVDKLIRNISYHRSPSPRHSIQPFSTSIASTGSLPSSNFQAGFTNKIQNMWSIATSVELLHSKNTYHGNLLFDNFADLFEYPKKRASSRMGNVDDNISSMENLSFKQVLSTLKLPIRCCAPEMLGLLDKDKCVMTIESDVWMFGVMTFEMLILNSDDRSKATTPLSVSTPDYANQIHSKFLYSDCKN